MILNIEDQLKVEFRVALEEGLNICCLYRVVFHSQGSVDPLELLEILQGKASFFVVSSVYKGTESFHNMCVTVDSDFLWGFLE